MLTPEAEVVCSSCSPGVQPSSYSLARSRHSLRLAQIDGLMRWHPVRINHQPSNPKLEKDMVVSRRDLLLATGGFGLVLAGTGIYSVTKRPGTALQPWEATAADADDVRLHALRHAILAPNPHNLQPWLFRLEGTNRVMVLHDAGRRLPQTDPHDRQITIGFGGLLELARQAAAQRGHRLEIEPNEAS